MNDLVGLDLGWRARKLGGMKPEDVPITARVADKLCELDRYGQKTSRGYYIYPEGTAPVRQTGGCENRRRNLYGTGY